MDIFSEYYHFCEIEMPTLLHGLPLSEKQKLAIYGMGEHTQHLLSGYQKQVGSINAELIFIDSKRKSYTSKYYGCDIYNVHDIGELELDGIIFSSYIYEEEMYKTMKELYGNRFKLYRFYSSNDTKYFLPSGIHWEWEYIPNLPVLRVKFVDMWKSFDFIDNVFVASLRNRYKMVISETPDIGRIFAFDCRNTGMLIVPERFSIICLMQLQSGTIKTGGLIRFDLSDNISSP